jgi:hypothetical protein
MKFKVGERVVVSSPLAYFGEENLKHKGKIGVIHRVNEVKHSEWGDSYYFEVKESGDLSPLFFESELSRLVDKEPEDWL